MATRWPASRELEREGDREYIAPEVLGSQKYDKPVDIFALGLTIVEAAGNEARVAQEGAAIKSTCGLSGAGVGGAPATTNGAVWSAYEHKRGYFPG